MQYRDEDIDKLARQLCVRSTKKQREELWATDPRLDVKQLCDGVDILLREVARLGYWECQSCGCRFNKPIRVFPNGIDELDGVKRCSKCVEAEIFAEQRDCAVAVLRKLYNTALLRGDVLVSEIGRLMADAKIPVKE